MTNQTPAFPIALIWLGRIVDLAVMIIGGLLITLVFFNVVLHAFAKDIAWVTELGEFLMVWVTFLGGVAATQRGAQMSITELLDKLQPKNRKFADVAIHLLCLAVLIILLIFGSKIVASSWGNVLTTLEWPMAWQYMPLPVACVLLMIFIGWDLLQTIRGVPRELRYLES